METWGQNCSDQITRLLQENKKLKQEIRQLEEDITTLKKEPVDWQQKYQIVEREKDELHKELSVMRKSRTYLENQVAQLGKENDRLCGDNTFLQYKADEYDLQVKKGQIQPRKRRSYNGKSYEQLKKEFEYLLKDWPEIKSCMAQTDGYIRGIKDLKKIYYVRHGYHPHLGALKRYRDELANSSEYSF